MNKLIIISCLLALLSACGWHLRGSNAMDLEIESVFLDSDNPYGDLSSEFTRSLAANRTTVTDSAEDAIYRIYLSDEKRSRRAVSVANDALVNEYEITLAVDYLIEKEGVLVVPTTRVEVARTYQYDRNAIVAKSEEEELIAREMQSALIQQILRRLRFVARAAQSSNDAVDTDGVTQP